MTAVALAAAGIVLLLIGLLAILSQLVVVSVHGGSMAPTLLAGDRVLVLRRWPRRWLRRGDMVLLKPAARFMNNSTIKRVGAVAGERVAPDREPRPDAAPWTGTLSKDEIFVLGESAESLDSRLFGPVNLREVSGLVLFRLVSRKGDPLHDR